MIWGESAFRIFKEGSRSGGDGVGMIDECLDDRFWGDYFAFVDGGSDDLLHEALFGKLANLLVHQGP